MKVRSASILLGLALITTHLCAQYELEKVPSPEGCAVYGLACDSAGTLYASTDEYGLYISRDGGTLWTKASIPLEMHRLTVQILWPLIVGPHGTVYAFSTFGSGTLPLLRSTDRGSTWVVVDSAARNHIGYSHMVAHGGALFSLSAKGFCRSDDDGFTWRVVSTPPQLDFSKGFRQTIFTFVSDSVVLVWANTVSRSTDQGATWSSTDIERLVTPFAVDDERGIVSIRSYSSKSRAYLIRRSTDAGFSWVLEDSISNATIRYEGWPDRIVRLSDGTLMCGGPNGARGVWIARDSMRFRWRAGLNNHIVHDLCVDTRGRILAATHAGVYASSDEGRTWNELNRGLPAREVTALFSSPNGTVFAGTRAGGLYVSRDSGRSWQPRGLDGMDVHFGIARETGGITAITRASEGVTLSHLGQTFPGYPIDSHLPSGSPAWTTDDGSSWKTQENTWCTSIVSDSRFRYYTNTRENNYSSDAGARWSTVPLLARARFLDSPADGTVFASVTAQSEGSRAREVVLPDSVLRSDDGGTHWRCIHTGPVYGMWSDDTMLCIHEGRTILRSADRGVSWQTVELPTFLQMPDQGISLRFQSAGTGLVSVSDPYGGLHYFSTDGGASWEAVNFRSGSVHSYYTSCLQTKDGQFLFGSTHGIYRARRVSTVPSD
ncbi:MAG: hypothetical protein HY962_06220 [Ignavibacteriae bacterium]|nr:hypothetical protein [Ignavibacteriota bacterium]